MVVADGAGCGPGERGGIANLDPSGKRRKGHAREPLDVVLAAYWTTCRYGTCKPRCRSRAPRSRTIKGRTDRCTGREDVPDKQTWEQSRGGECSR
ncbi:hypothetical protein GCM10010451_06470 [Streptomyces virens]|uniref:Transposase n=1 Tax=Streptomyces virens TaxID=285572 RepID=A0ABP6NYK7_9ACTN